jgi:hypothetical protein
MGAIILKVVIWQQTIFKASQSRENWNNVRAQRNEQKVSEHKRTIEVYTIPRQGVVAWNRVSDIAMLMRLESGAARYIRK